MQKIGILLGVFRQEGGVLPDKFSHAFSLPITQPIPEHGWMTFRTTETIIPWSRLHLLHHHCNITHHGAVLTFNRPILKS